MMLKLVHTIFDCPPQLTEGERQDMLYRLDEPVLVHKGRGDAEFYCSSSQRELDLISWMEKYVIND